MSAMATDDQAPSQPILSANEKFFRYFQNEVKALQQEISRISTTTIQGGERADAIDHSLSAISRLSTEVQDASSYIPAYDQRTYGEAIKGLNQKLQEVRAASAPKPKFAFKSSLVFTAKKNESAISLSDAAELARQRQKQISSDGSMSGDSSFVNSPAGNGTPADELEDVSSLKANPMSVSNRENEHIVLCASDTHATSSGTISYLSRCVVNASQSTKGVQPLATLTIKSISNSLIICGHVSGAAHITSAQNSTIVVASRQFRMHESSNCDVYLLVGSRPIIEDCSGIRFAPLPETFLRDGDESNGGKWEEVDDFKWLKTEPSPNWSALPVDERIEESVWRNKVPGGPELGVEDILDSVGIAK